MRLVGVWTSYKAVDGARRIRYRMMKQAANLGIDSRAAMAMGALVGAVNPIPGGGI